mgnify:CR=1 FL=1
MSFTLGNNNNFANQSFNPYKYMNSYEDLLNRYRDDTDQALCEVVRYQDDYTDEAVRAAKDVLSERGIEAPEKEVREDKRTRELREHKPLTTLEKVGLGILLAFIPITFTLCFFPNTGPYVRSFAFRFACFYIGGWLLIFAVAMLVG